MMCRGVKGFTLIEMMLANALALMLLAALIGFLFVIKRQSDAQVVLMDLQEREQHITMLLSHDLSHADPKSIIFSKNKITLQLEKKYKSKTQLVTESLYVAKGSLFEKNDHKRSEALIPFVNKLKAQFDPLSHHRGVKVNLEMASEYSQKCHPWFLYVALRDH